MTARSGDALSHFNFQARQNAVLTEIRAPEILARREQRSARLPTGAHPFLSYLHGGYEAAPRNDAGRSASFAHYLPKSFRAKT
jgi:hypothetical protein